MQVEEPLIQEINSDSTSMTPVLFIQSSPSAHPPPPPKELAHALQASQHAGHHLQTVSFNSWNVRIEMISFLFHLYSCVKSGYYCGFQQSWN